MANQPQQPIVTGLSLYQDGYWGYEFYYPISWHQFAWMSPQKGPPQTGLLFGPSAADTDTHFQVTARRLGAALTQLTRPQHTDQFLSSLRRLSQCRIDSIEQWNDEHLLCLDAICIFEEAGHIRKCWIRYLGQDTRQLILRAQGKSVLDFDSWQPVFQKMVASFRLYPHHR